MAMCEIPRAASAHTGVVRRCGALSLSLLVMLGQAGPGLACAAFDGPAGPGCPAIFRHASGYDLSSLAEDETEGQPGGGTRDDCSTGPAYLVADLEPPHVSDPPAADPGVYLPELLAADDSPAPAVRIVPSDSLVRATASGGRHAYLTTLRLRI